MRNWIMVNTLNAYAFLLPLFDILFWIALLVLLPLAFFKKTKVLSGQILFGTSYLFGITTWFLGAGITFGIFGWFGLIVGLLILGVGVVPLGIIGAFMKINSTLGLVMLAMAATTWGARIGGAYLIAAAKQDEE